MNIIKLSFLFFSFWGIYMFGVRPFDLISIGFIIILLRHTVNQPIFFINRKYLLMIILILGLFLGYSLLGIVNSYTGNVSTGPHSPLDNLKLGIGLSLCLFIFIIIYSIDFNVKKLQPLINKIILFHGLFIFLQFFSYYLFNVFINPLSILMDSGIYSVNILSDRALSQTDYLMQRSIAGGSLLYRPAGFFTEPSAYSITMIILLASRMHISRKLNFPIIVGSLSVIMTFSLWGIISIATLFMIYRGKFFLIVFPIVVLYLGFFLKDLIFLGSSSPIWRLFNLWEDTSFLDRFNFFVGRQYEAYDLFTTFFGHGLIHGNGNFLSMILSSFGVIGTIFLFVMVFRLLNRSGRIQSLIIIGLLLMHNEQILTLFIFWAWLAVISKDFLPENSYG